jgi:hypothetical protein
MTNSSRPRNTAPLLLSQVEKCRPIRVRLLELEPPFNNLPTFYLWMQRSGDSPLVFYADADSLDTILPYSHRWGRVRIDLKELQPSLLQKKSEIGSPFSRNSM